MKKNGFTLIELIVVIAIIGVLAAILVPSMLGYVTKSKCTSANSNAKSLYNAVNTSLVDLDSEGKDITALAGDIDVTSLAAAEDATTEELATKVTGYFADVAKLTDGSVRIDEGGACTAVVVQNGAYWGSYPKVTSADEDASGEDISGYTKGDISLDDAEMES